jgi:hypothetical protein
MTFFFKKTLALSKKVDPTLKIVKDHKHVVNNFFLFLILTIFFLFFLVKKCTGISLWRGDE